MQERQPETEKKQTEQMKTVRFSAKESEAEQLQVEQSDDVRQHASGKNSTFEELLEREGRLVYTNRGVSMMPLLRQGKDLFVITRAEERLKRYDVALYRRRDQYVLHRVLKVLPEGYIICGDHCWQKERVSDAQILGVMTSFVRDGREIPVTDRRYLVYVHLWCDFFVLRAFFLRTRAFCRKTVRRIKRLCGNYMNKKSSKK